jgi:excisionase family DNA binding protein
MDTTDSGDNADRLDGDRGSADVAVSGMSEVSEMTASQAAAYLGVSERTVRRYITSGKLTAHRIMGPYGAEYRIHPSALEAMRQHRDVIDATPAPVRTDSGDGHAGPLVRAMPDAMAALVAHLERLDQERSAYVVALAAKDETIEELRRRAEAAEAEAQALKVWVEKPAPMQEERRSWWRRLFGWE